ncbi:MAG TPA: peptidoglycan DD-metalloendopeptidase family protein [Dongiaceae bacterium]|nr:peptidoglycan DD-metalloendopeptidase family protein [Dongiaceae bacterium]
MIRDLSAATRERLRAAFAPRELIVRNDGRVRYLRLSTRVQVAVVGALGALAIAACATSIGMVVQQFSLHAEKQAVRKADDAYTNLLTEVTGYFDQFTGRADAIQGDEASLLGLTRDESSARQRLGADPKAHFWQVWSDDPVEREALRETLRAALQQKLTSFDADLKRIAERNHYLATQFAEIQARARQLGQDRNDLATDRNAIAAKLLNQQNSNRDLAGQVANLTEALRQVRGALQSETTKSAALDRQADTLQQQLDATRSANADLAMQVDQDTRALATAIAQRNLLQTARTDMAGTVEDLKMRLASLQESQASFVSHLTERARQNLGDMEKTVQMTGLSVDKLLHLTSEPGAGEGGPFVPAPTDSRDANERKLLESVATLDDEVGRWEKLQVILRSLPLSAPVDHYYISSGFGERTDPFNGEGAIHEGLDMVDTIRAEVLATAPGRVVFAGWRGSYGRCVEIDHGLGITTVYAHLDSVLVKEGDLVDYRQAIGKLGNSGRSSGPHVHYEVRFEGKALDPMGFLKAGRYVFKG